MNVSIPTDRSGISAKCVLSCPVTTHLSFWHKGLKYIVPGGGEMPLGTERLTPLKAFRFVTPVIIVLDSIKVYQVSVWETFAWNSACELDGVESGFLIPLEGWERIGSLVPSWSFLSVDERISAN